MVHDIDSCNIQWDTNQDWTTNSKFSDINKFHNHFRDVKKNGESNYQSHREFYFEYLNTEKNQVQYMMEMTCIQDINESSTDYSNGIGRLQVLLGSGGMGKYVFIDAVATTLVQCYGWDDEKIYIHAMDGKSATSIGGLTAHNYKDGLGFILPSVLRKLSSKMLLIFQYKWKHRRMIIIDKFSMLQQK